MAAAGLSLNPSWHFLCSREPPSMAHMIHTLLLCAFECSAVSALNTLVPQIKVPEFRSHTTVATDI